MTPAVIDIENQIHHLHKNKLDKDHNLFYLFIPLLVFALILALLLGNTNNTQVATESKETKVLGEEDATLDKNGLFGEN